MHRLLSDLAVFVPSPNRGARLRCSCVDTIVIHYTAVPTLGAAVKMLCDPASRVSAHFVIDRGGDMVQLVELDTVSWHAGNSVHGERTGLNEFSIGIELVNAGRLQRTSDGEFLTWAGAQVNPSETVQLVHRNETEASWWHTYSPEQIQACFVLMRRLMTLLSIKHILGHEEVAPGRKWDPGPAFPLDALRLQLLMNRR